MGCWRLGAKVHSFVVAWRPRPAAGPAAHALQLSSRPSCSRSRCRRTPPSRSWTPRPRRCAAPRGAAARAAPASPPARGWRRPCRCWLQPPWGRLLRAMRRAGTPQESPARRWPAAAPPAARAALPAGGWCCGAGAASGGGGASGVRAEPPQARTPQARALLLPRLPCGWAGARQGPALQPQAGWARAQAVRAPQEQAWSPAPRRASGARAWGPGLGLPVPPPGAARRRRAAGPWWGAAGAQGRARAPRRAPPPGGAGARARARAPRGGRGRRCAARRRRPGGRRCRARRCAGPAPGCGGRRRGALRRVVEGFQRAGSVEGRQEGGGVARLERLGAPQGTPPILKARLRSRRAARHAANPGARPAPPTHLQPLTHPPSAGCRGGTRSAPGRAPQAPGCREGVMEGAGGQWPGRRAPCKAPRWKHPAAPGGAAAAVGPLPHLTSWRLKPRPRGT